MLFLKALGIILFNTIIASITLVSLNVTNEFVPMGLGFLNGWLVYLLYVKPNLEK